MRIFSFISLFLIGFITVKAQCLHWNSGNISPSILQTCDTLSKAEQVEAERIGVSAYRSRTFLTYKRLESLSSLDELITLTNYPSPIVRCYSFRGLIDKKVDRSKLLSLVYLHLCDTEKVTSQAGCIVHTTKVGDFMLENIYYNEVFNLTETEKKTIDSLLFWVPHFALNERKDVVKETKATKANYIRLKSLLLDEGVDDALLPILEYKNENDMGLIREMIKRNPSLAFDAISKYPLEQFKEALNDWQKKDEDCLDMTWLKFYKAVIAYNSSFSIEVLQSHLTGKVNQCSEEHAERIYWSLKDNKNQIYDSVKILTLSYANNFELSYFNELWRIDSARCIKVIEQRLTSEQHPFWDDKLLSLMANRLVYYEKDNAINLINRVLRIGYSSTFLAFSKMANKTHNSETITIYKKRFYKDKHTSDQSLDYGIEGILAFNNDSLYREIERRAFSYAKLKKFKYSRSLKKLLIKINPKRAEELKGKYE